MSIKESSTNRLNGVVAVAAIDSVGATSTDESVISIISNGLNADPYSYGIEGVVAYTAVEGNFVDPTG